MTSDTSCIAFQGVRRIASGKVAEVALLLRKVSDTGEPILIFDDETSSPVELDLRGNQEAVEARYTPEEPVRRVGRPKLGTVAREVSLLPRHWEWLAGQPGGVSVALRKVVEEARRQSEGRDRVRRARESAYRFMLAMAGNEPGYEEALRALFSGDYERLELMTAVWPADVRAHALMLAARAR